MLNIHIYSSLTSSVPARFGRHGMPPPVCNPEIWPFDLETSVRVASKVGNLPSKFGHAKSLGSWVIRYVRDRQTNRWMDTTNAYYPLPYGRGIITIAERQHTSTVTCTLAHWLVSNKISQLWYAECTHWQQAESTNQPSLVTPLALAKQLA